jgi:DNA-binding NarL/FixJ family response regulator
VTIRVLIVDDQALARLGLRAILEAEQDIEVVGEAGSGREALEKAVALRPDLALVDVIMPGGDGIEAARAIKQRCPNTEILILTVHGDLDLLRKAATAGATGYLLKDIPPTNLVNAIRDIHGGKTMIYPAIARRMVGDYRSGKGMPALTAVGQRYGLTQRKMDVLLEVALGLSDKEIASKLFLSKSTVKTHLRAIFHKLKIRNRTEAAAFVMAHGLLAGVTSAPRRSK